MSRVSKWKIDKTKIKVVFRLQFHATHIPQSGWDKLYISFVPADTGKTTAKTTKANVRNGTCKWGDPIYETTRLLQDVKTKQFDEKLYKLVVAMGSSRSSLLGEATINLADYADASKPSVVSLPLLGCDCGAILHVTVQLLTSKTGFREFEQQRELRERGLQMGPDQNGPDQSYSGKVPVSEETAYNRVDKVNAKVRFKEKSKGDPLLEDVGLNEDCGDSAVGFDGSSNTSESLYSEKHDTSMTQEIESLKSTASGDLAGLGHSPQQEKGDPSDHQLSAQGTNGLIHGWSSDYSADNGSTNAYEENSKLRRCLEVAESSIQELKMELSLLQNHASQIGDETEKFAEQLVAEIYSGERLAAEVSALKSECSKLKDDFERMRSSKQCSPLTSNEPITKDQNLLLQDLEVTWSKGLLVMEAKIRELQNKACSNSHERDHRFLHADLEALLGILQDFKQRTQKEISILRSVPSARCNIKGPKAVSLINGDPFIPETSFDVELYQPELGMVPHVSEPGHMSHEPDSVGATNAMNGKIFELLRELDESKAERGSLVKKMEQMECYYEALVQELEENQGHMLGELQTLTNEHSTCLYRVQSTKAEMETMRQNMNEEILRFSEEKQDLESLSKELERRAIIAEAALKRARLNYSVAVGQLQKDLELLSSQVMSVFETNENLIREAFVDSSQSNSLECSEMVPSHGLDSEDFQPTKPLHCQIQHVGVKKQQLGGDILLEDLKRSLHLQESLYRKVEEEVCEMHYQNVYLDMFSKTLQETLLEAIAVIQPMKERTDGLTRQLELSAECKELLMQRLETAMNDVYSLNEYKATCIAKNNDMVLQTQTLEKNVENVTHENHLLSEKITDLECLLMEYRSYKSKYDACVSEKTKLANLLKEETLENGNLRNNNSTLQEELRMIKTEFDELVILKKILQNTVDFLQNRLLTLLSSHDKFFAEPSFSSQDIKSKDLTSVMVRLEEVQSNAHEKFLHLIKEKKDLEGERDKAQMSLSVAESDMVLMKQKFGHDIRSMVEKIDLSNVVVQKLESKIEVVAEKLNVSSEVEETYAQKQRNLLSDLDHFEAALQELTSKNIEIAEQILVLESVNEELGTSNLTVAKLMEENKMLVQCLHDKSEESSKLTLEINGLQESLHSLHGELKAERSSKEKIESMVADLTSQLNEKYNQLSHFHKQKSELVHLRQMLSDLESEKSRVCSLLQQREECLNNAREESSTITFLESQLSEMHEFSVAADVSLIYLKTQYGTGTTDLVCQLSIYEKHLVDLQNKHLDVEGALNGCLARETRYIEENGRLSASLDSLKSELEAAMAENRVLLTKNSYVIAELEDCEKRLEKNEFDYSEDNIQLALEVDRLKHLLAGSQEEIDNLLVAKEELKLKSEESSKLTLEINGLKESLPSLHDELNAERSSKEKLESMVADLTSQMNEKHGQLLHFHKQKSELVHLKQMLSDLESEKSRVCSLLQQREECLNNAREESSTITFLESQLSEMHKISVAADVSLIFLRTQYETGATDLVCQLSIYEKHLVDLQKKHLDVESALNGILTRETRCIEENGRLLASLDSLKSELDSATAENRLLLTKNSSVIAELEDYERRLEKTEFDYCEDKNQLALEVDRLKHLLAGSQEEIDNLMVSKEELELNFLVVNVKLDEQSTQINLQETQNSLLQKQCNELSQRLSEQVLKTEEFKNLSVHLKELKDKADAESTQVRDKRESEAPPTAAMQESLRIAFIKEQYETRLQELKQQLAVSKKHSEEILWKLQDAIDDIDKRKKSEASYLKRNEELGVKILKLESELQSLISDKREKMRAYDLTKAELDCSMISLECCKEEKQKLEASLQECNEEKSKISIELSIVKYLLETSTSTMHVQKERNDETKDGCVYDDPGVNNASTRDVDHKSLNQDNSANSKEAGHPCLDLINEGECASALTNLQPEQDLLVSNGANGVQSLALANQENLFNTDAKHLAVINDRFKVQCLRSSMDHLNSELERMKNENMALSEDVHHFNPKFPGLEEELVQLHKVNEELGSIFPFFNEYSESGNALERVLALELELAEALQTKKKSSSLFQSSFLKQHNDERAVVKTFRDINELIKDMLEIKGRYGTVETQLKEMHERYSQLSLQFAEIEGERQKLIMTLKNVRASRKPKHSNGASSASLRDTIPEPQEHN